MTESFLGPHNIQRKEMQSASQLDMGFFDEIGKWFNETWGNQDDIAGAYEDEVEILKPTVVLRIPVENIKIGGLRLLLTFYLMGMQNTPEKNSWRTSQPSDDNSIEFFFHDMSAALRILLSEDEITINRIGAVPSNAYLMQESVIIQGILDEIEKCVKEGEIQRSDRLVLLPDPGDAIEKARDTLAFN